MDAQNAVFEDRLLRLHDTTGKIQQPKVAKPVVEKPAKKPGKQRSFLLTLIQTASVVALCVLCYQVFDLAVSLQEFAHLTGH